MIRGHPELSEEDIRAALEHASEAVGHTEFVAIGWRRETWRTSTLFLTCRSKTGFSDPAGQFHIDGSLLQQTA
jgi:hypothetical protein